MMTSGKRFCWAIAVFFLPPLVLVEFSIGPVTAVFILLGILLMLCLIFVVPTDGRDHHALYHKAEFPTQEYRRLRSGLFRILAYIYTLMCGAVLLIILSYKYDWYGFVDVLAPIMDFSDRVFPAAAHVRSAMVEHGFDERVGVTHDAKSIGLMGGAALGCAMAFYARVLCLQHAWSEPGSSLRMKIWVGIGGLLFGVLVCNLSFVSNKHSRRGVFNNFETSDVELYLNAIVLDPFGPLMVAISVLFFVLRAWIAIFGVTPPPPQKS